MSGEEHSWQREQQMQHLRKGFLREFKGLQEVRGARSAVKMKAGIRNEITRGGRKPNQLQHLLQIECLCPLPPHLPNSYVKILTPIVMVSGDGDFGG